MISLLLPANRITAHPSPTSLPPEAILSDDAIELRLLRILPPGDTAARPPEARFLSAAPEYRFAIHRRGDGLRVGRIHLRVTDDPLILRALGQNVPSAFQERMNSPLGKRKVRLRGL